MQKGIDFLLGQEKNGNWEVDNKWPGQGEVGGVSAVTLYALLHAGESLQDDPAYHSKLNWRSKDMAPAIAWLSKNMPEDTYVAGLESSALTLIPRLKDQKPDEGTEPALEAAKWYLLTAMGADGGYSYTGPKDQFDGAWQAYLEAGAQANTAKGKTAFATAKTNLDNTAKGLYDNFGGPQLVIEKKIIDLNKQLKDAKDNRTHNQIENEINDLESYSRQIPAPTDERAVYTSTRKELNDLIGRKGNPAGLTTYDNSTKKNRPMTRDELPEKIKSLQRTLDQAEADLKGVLQPRGDLSNGQYGTLGAWALVDSDSHIEMPDKYWQVTDRFWRFMQQPDGGWPYSQAKDESRDTMSVAGIASLFIAQEFVDTDLRLVPKPDKNIDSGLAWLVKNYAASSNLYFMYGVERVGLSSGLKFFGTQDWYKQGAALLVKSQAGDGSWSGGFYGGQIPAVGTSYALLFLARGRNPVVFNKLQYNGPWDARPRDDAYVTRWMSKRFEKPINWQVVNLQVSPDEWMDAPVLLITGSVDPKFTKDDIDKLRTFVNAGGMIFSTADGNRAAFTAAIKKYAAEVVNDKYEMRQLPRNHLLFSKDMGVDMPNPPPILGISNGVREVWIHSPQDVGADWQTRKYTSKHFELGAAIYFYASGMGSLRSKLQPLTVAVPDETPARTIAVARVDYAGNPDPEPGAWPRMARIARADFGTQVDLATVPISGLDPKKFPLAHLTGTATMNFAPADVQAFQAYVNGGGLLFIDAAGGSADFAASARNLIKQIYPNDPLTPVPQTSPILTGKIPDGEPIADVEFRKYGNLKLQHRVTSVAMDEVDVGGRTRIFFSQWDICSGFLGTNTWGIMGYAPATSEQLGRNILLYAQNPVPTAVSDDKTAAKQ